MDELYEYFRSYISDKQMLVDCVNEVSETHGWTQEEVVLTLLKSFDDISNKCILSNNIILKDYQEQIVHFMLRNRGCIVSFDVGTGKTLTAVASAICVIRQAKLMKKDIQIIVITPVSLKDNFINAMKQYGINDKLFKKFKFYTYQGYVNAYSKGEIDCENSFLIIDEAHNLRTDFRGEFSLVKKQGTRAEVIMICAQYAWKVMLLTGTPAYNRPHDILNLVAMVKGKTALNSKRYNEILNNDKLFQDYFKCVFAFRKASQENYPIRIDKFIKIVMTKEAYEKYKIVEKNNKPKNFKFDIDHHSTDEKKEEQRQNFLIKLRQATNDIEPCSKCKKVIELLSTGLKTIIYSQFLTSGIRKVQKFLDDENIQYYEISGETEKDSRQEIVNKFNDDDIQVLFITQAGGEGLDLKGIRQVIIMERGWNNSTIEQVVGRAVRYMSHSHLPEDERNVTVYHLVSSKPKNNKDSITYTADELLLEVSLKKDKEIKQLMLRIENISIDKTHC